MSTHIARIIRGVRVIRTVACLLAPTLGARAGFTGLDCDDSRVPDRMIVHIAEGADIGTFIDAFVADHPTVGLAAVDQVPGRRIHLLSLALPDGWTEAFIDQLEADLKHDYLDILVSAAGTGAGDFLYVNEGPEGKTGSVWASGLSQFDYDTQYAVPLLGVPAAQGMTTGGGTVVAVLDTGVDSSHPALAGRVVAGGYNFVDGNDVTDDVGDGMDTDGDGDIDELTGHGTFVAGLITLVAPDARILPVRVLDGDGNGDEWMLTRGIYHAIDRGVEVINLSLGSTYDTVSVKQAILDAALKGIVIVSSAGNCRRSDPREFPAMDDIGLEDPVVPLIEIEGALGIAATNPDDVKADFSNFNRRLFLCAPGDTADGPLDPARAIVGILPQSEYGAWEGTSFATAFTTGTAALVRAQHPEWAPDLGTYTNVLNVLAVSAADVYAVNPQYAQDMELGAGRLDVAAAAALGPVAPPLGDLDGNGAVQFADLLILLRDWGLVHSSADLNGNGVVEFGDLLILLGNWG